MIVGLIVALIVVVTVAVPIIDDSANMITKDQNNSSYTFMLSSKNDNITIELVDGSVMIDGAKASIGNYIPFVISDNFIAASTGGALRTFSGESAYSFTKMEINNNIARMSTAEGEITELQFTKLWVYSETGGDYGLFRMGNNRTMYVSENTPYYAVLFNSYQAGIGYFYGVYEFMNSSQIGVVIPAAYGEDLSGTPTVATTVNIVPGFDESKNLEHAIFIDNNLNSMVATIDDKTIADGSKSILAPIAYSVVDTDNPIYSIISVIPIMLIVSMVIAIIGLFIARSE